ncbi:hypothetical protein C8R41DRAFT_865541 [Lentinula lateritia]|uniref:Uncharacterized protein n=1 Tax=Lentinula lateritia TaxID=40482 RepID=A0ABQ8VM65_9AGAR|nr:hypothetical protein C8R41DRAFT_865541 [Lentinula lateritia]
MVYTHSVLAAVFVVGAASCALAFPVQGPSELWPHNERSQEPSNYQTSTVVARRASLDTRGGDNSSDSGSQDANPKSESSTSGPNNDKEVDLSNSPALKNGLNLFKSLRNKQPFEPGAPYPRVGGHLDRQSSKDKRARRNYFDVRDTISATSGSDAPIISTKTPAESVFAGTVEVGSPSPSNAGPTGPIELAGPAESALPHGGHHIRSYGEDLD